MVMVGRWVGRYCIGAVCVRRRVSGTGQSLHIGAVALVVRFGNVLELDTVRSFEIPYAHVVVQPLLQAVGIDRPR